MGLGELYVSSTLVLQDMEQLGGHDGAQYLCLETLGLVRLGSYLRDRGSGCCQEHVDVGLG